MKGLKKVTFEKITHWLDGEKRKDDWPAYTGGPIPAGLGVSKVARLEDPTVPTSGWTVSHLRSGYCIDRVPYLGTRKLAIEWAEGLGEVAERFEVSWDQDKDAMMDHLWRTGKYHDFHAAVKGVIQAVLERHQRAKEKKN